MCMRTTNVRPHQCWNWGGDEIVHDTIIKAKRTIPGTRVRNYKIDIRQFISCSGNAVLGEAVSKIKESLSPEEKILFQSKSPGAFDFRKDAVLEYMANFNYKPITKKFTSKPGGRKFEPWLFPVETYRLKHGDCEDLAFLIAALLEACGISPYCIRVALGIVIDHSAPKGGKRWDHAWVMYKDEGGAWELIEPLAHCKNTFIKEDNRERVVALPQLLDHVSKEKDIEYVPYFVFNHQHLWRVRSPFAGAGDNILDYLKGREFWKNFNPGFAYKAHNNMLNEALSGMKKSMLRTVKRVGFWVDVNVLKYDPREHFDFAYIDEGWALVKQRLATGNIVDFGLAVHAVADFYAHSMYGHFAPRDQNGAIAPYSQAFDPGTINYDFSRFDVPGCKTGKGEAAGLWNGKLISGQWWRWYTAFPDHLEDADDFWQHRCLPDHDSLAVDGPKQKLKEGHFYQSKTEFKEQFCIRKAAAITHIQALYRLWNSR